MVPGVILSAIAAVAVTLLDKAPAKEVTDIYDMATAPDAFEAEDAEAENPENILE